jgi:hypothetical protein
MTASRQPGSSPKGSLPLLFTLQFARGNRAKSFELVPGATAGIPMGMKNHPLILTEIDLAGWLEQAAPGDAIEYHRGFLALDRCRVVGRMGEQDATELSRVADRAWWSAQRGLAHLLQRRDGPADYTYLLVARPRSPSHALSELITTEVA